MKRIFLLIILVLSILTQNIQAIGFKKEHYGYAASAVLSAAGLFFKYYSICDKRYEGYEPENVKCRKVIKKCFCKGNKIQEAYCQHILISDFLFGASTATVIYTFLNNKNK